MNKSLIKSIEEFQPHLCFFVLFTDEIDKRTIRWITEKSGTVTFNWFCDDHWRFHSFSRHWAPLFHWIATTDADSIPGYQQIGMTNAIRSQWGFNHYLTVPFECRNGLDVTFIGQVHSSRQEMIGRIQQAGIDVQCWGKGWTNGRVSFDSMVQIFQSSRINLNFSESSNAYNFRSVAKVFLNRRADNTYRINSARQMMRNTYTLFHERRPQIKARNFEIPGYGGFLMTSDVSHLGEYFEVGKEIVCFTKINDLVEKIRYYLTHENERETIRLAGQKRTLRDHAYEMRFNTIFKMIGLI